MENDPTLIEQLAKRICVQIEAHKTQIDTLDLALRYGTDWPDSMRVTVGRPGGQVTVSLPEYEAGEVLRVLRERRAGLVDELAGHRACLGHLAAHI